MSKHVLSGMLESRPSRPSSPAHSYKKPHACVLLSNYTCVACDMVLHVNWSATVLELWASCPYHQRNAVISARLCTALQPQLRCI